MAATPYRIPSEPERQILFAWLKRSSSLIAWECLFKKYQAFSAAVERAFMEDQRTPLRADEQLIPNDWMSQVLACQAAFEAALKRLQRGERRCFLFLGASGHFYQATLAALWWKEMDDRERHMGGTQFSPNQSPLWPEIEKALNDFLDVYYDIAVVLQDRFTDVPAPIANLDDIEPPFWAKLVQRVPADPSKARVPTPPEPLVIVKTKNTIPEHGVWEPVAKVSTDVYQIDGAMNYLHGGQLAPTIAFAGDGPRREGRSTLWRLIWADRRYEDGRIPVDEKTNEFGGTMSP